MGGYTRWSEAYLVTLTDRCSFLCVSGQRETIAKSMHEEHLCVVALTSMERGTRSFRLPLTSLCDRLLLFVYFQVNNEVVYCRIDLDRRQPGKGFLQACGVVAKRGR